MKLANLLAERRINLNLVADTKDAAIAELISMIQDEGLALRFDSILESIREREEIENTSYGRGFAFPHARTDAVDELYILVGVSKKGLRDKTPDGVPLHIICLLLTPATIAKLYLQTLSGFAALARSAGSLEKILAITNKREFIKMVSDANVTVDKELMVKDVMRYVPATVTPEHTLRDAANFMFRHRMTAIPVLDPEGKMIGVIDDRDLIKAALPDYKTLISNLNYSMDVEPFEELLKNEDKIRVAQLYREKFEETAPNTLIVEVAAMMIFKDIRRVFVTENGKLVGALLRSDIVNMIIRG